MVMKALSQLVISIVARHDPRGFKKLDKNIKYSTRNALRFGRTMSMVTSGIRRDIGALAVGLGAGIGLANLVDTAKHLDTIKTRFETVAGSAEKAQKLFEYSSNAARKYGLNLRTTEKGLTLLLGSTKGSNISLEQGIEIFDNLSKVMAGMKLSTAEAEGAILAFGQIISKGKVQAEELRRQLANRIPGAFSIAAKSLGMTSAELDQALRDGAVSSEALVKIAAGLAKEFGQNYEKATKGAVGSLNRLGNSFDELGRIIVEKGFNKLLLNMANSMEKFLLTKKAQKFAESIGDIFKNLNNLFNLIKENKEDIKNWLAIVTVIGSIVFFLPTIVKIAGWLGFIGKLLLEFRFLKTIGLLLWNIRLILTSITIATAPLWAQALFFIGVVVLIGDLLYTIITYLTTGEAKGLLWINAFRTISDFLKNMKDDIAWIFKEMSKLFKFKGIANFGIGGSFGSGVSIVEASKAAQQASQIRNSSQSNQISQTNNINVENYGGNEQKITESIVNKIPTLTTPSYVLNMGV